MTDTVQGAFDCLVALTWLPGVCNLCSAILFTVLRAIKGERENSGFHLEQQQLSYLSHLISLGNTLPFISATSQISGKECSYEFPLY